MKGGPWEWGSGSLSLPCTNSDSFTCGTPARPTPAPLDSSKTYMPREAFMAQRSQPDNTSRLCVIVHTPDLNQLPNASHFSNEWLLVGHQPYSPLMGCTPCTCLYLPCIWQSQYLPWLGLPPIYPVDQEKLFWFHRKVTLGGF